MIVVYIAGPYRGKHAYEVHRNICAAEAAAFLVWSNGMAALCPHTNTAHFDGALPDHVWLDGDLELLRRCDALYMVAGWERSSGVGAELLFAVDHGIPTFQSFDRLLEWKVAREANAARVRLDGAGL